MKQKTTIPLILNLFQKLVEGFGPFEGINCLYLLSWRIATGSCPVLMLVYRDAS